MYTIIYIVNFTLFNNYIICKVAWNTFPSFAILQEHVSLYETNILQYGESEKI